MSLKRTVSEALIDIPSNHNEKRVRINRSMEERWEPLETSAFSYVFEDIPKEVCFPILQSRSGHESIVGIFTTFIDHKLIQDVLDHLPLDAWIVNKSRNQYFQPSVEDIYTMLAVYIRIQALQKETDNPKNERPLDTAAALAMAHFKEKFPQKKGVGLTRMNILLQRFIIPDQYYTHLSANFQSLVTRLGQYCVGDEKLLHVTGNAGSMRMVLSKPDRKGLWLYSLTTPLSCGLPYLLYGRLHMAISLLDETIPIQEIVNEWADILQGRLQDDDPTRNNPDCMLCMDVYHLTNDCRLDLNRRKVKFVADVSKERFGTLMDMVEAEVTKRGDWSGIYKPSDPPELFVYHWQTNKEMKKKCCLTNAFHKQPKTPDAVSLSRIPAYDACQCMLDVCDRFNRNLHDRTWPHKRGGKGTNGEYGYQHSLFMSCCLENTINAYCEMKRLDPTTVSFTDLCLELADALYERFAKES